MLEVLGIVFGTVSVVPIFKFSNENKLTNVEKKWYPVLGLLSLVLCMSCSLLSLHIRGY